MALLTCCSFQLTAARRRLPFQKSKKAAIRRLVSTHSRSKAAAQLHHFANRAYSCFNSQPLEGGCETDDGFTQNLLVSTHSRSKAAAYRCLRLTMMRRVSTHSRSKAAADTPAACDSRGHVSTHSRSKAAALARPPSVTSSAVSTHSRSKAAAATRRGLNRQHQRFNSQPLEGGCSLHQNLRKIS